MDPGHRLQQYSTATSSVEQGVIRAHGPFRTARRAPAGGGAAPPRTRWPDPRGRRWPAACRDDLVSPAVPDPLHPLVRRRWRVVAGYGASRPIRCYRCTGGRSRPRCIGLPMLVPRVPLCRSGRVDGS